MKSIKRMNAAAFFIISTLLVGGGSVSNAAASRGSGMPSNPVPTPNLADVDDTGLMLPRLGNQALHILSPTMLELKRINTKAPDPARVDSWDFVSNGAFNAP